MLTTRVIPCLDVKDGRVVKGVNFVDLVDAGDPVAQARLYDREGADELCFLDITASSDGRDTLYDVVARTAEVCFMPLTVGGGVRKIEDIRKLLLAGADKVSIMTAAVKTPEFVTAAAEKFGSQCIVVALDAKETAPGRFEIFTHGGREPTGLDAVDWARRMAAGGAGEILLTSMDRDGTQSGFNLALTRAVADAVPIPVIASGGVGTLDHFVDGVTAGHASAVLAASVFHFGTFRINQVKAHMARAGLAVRPTADKPMTEHVLDRLAATVAAAKAPIRRPPTPLNCWPAAPRWRPVKWARKPLKRWSRRWPRAPPPWPMKAPICFTTWWCCGPPPASIRRMSGRPSNAARALPASPKKQPFDNRSLTP